MFFNIHFHIFASSFSARFATTKKWADWIKNKNLIQFAFHAWKMIRLDLALRSHFSFSSPSSLSNVSRRFLRESVICCLDALRLDENDFYFVIHHEKCLAAFLSRSLTRSSSESFEFVEFIHTQKAIGREMRRGVVWSGALESLSLLSKLPRILRISLLFDVWCSQEFLATSALVIHDRKTISPQQKKSLFFHNARKCVSSFVYCAWTKN